MHISPGTILRTTKGHRLLVENEIGAGAQGTVAHAQNRDAGIRGVVKAYHPEYCTSDMSKRIDFLVGLQLHRRCPVFVGPTEAILTGGVMGHFSGFAEGSPPSEFLVKTPCTFMDALLMGVVISHALDVLHAMGIAHGDIRDNNMLVCRQGGVVTPHIIDVDNFVAKGIPKPCWLGDLLYLASELSVAMKQNRPAFPDLYTDRFAHGVLMHEIVLQKHPATGYDDTEEKFAQAMYGGPWVHDPAVPTYMETVGGYPSTVLSSRVANLFRRFLSKDRTDRPSPAEWRDELLPVLGQVFVCPACQGPCMIDSSKWSCPFCKRPYPVLKLLAPGGRVVPLTAGCVRVGRDHLGASNRVSALHAIFRRIGPEVWIESIGRNGTCRRAGSQWIRIPDGKGILVRAGDILRLADVEVQIVQHWR